MKEKVVTIKDIRQSLYDAYLDSEYREAMSHAIMILGYVSDSPLKLHFGTDKQKEEIERVESMPLDSNQISEIIHLMMYEMRNDFQYGRFKPIAIEYIKISEQMKKEKINNDNTNLVYQKLKANSHYTYGNMYKIIGLASKTLKENNMYNESREMIERATLSYDYDDALNIIEEYVEMVDELESEEEIEH